MFCGKFGGFCSDNNLFVFRQIRFFLGYLDNNFNDFVWVMQIRKFSYKKYFFGGNPNRIFVVTHRPDLT
jgi:hypothetical protein